jgi:pilus assembly protein CpaE
MSFEKLNAAVLFASGAVRPEIQEALASLPRLNIIGQTCDPADLLDLQGDPADLVLVELPAETDLPEYLEKLLQKLPQTCFIACSDKWKTDFLIRALKAGVRDFLTLPLSRTDLAAAIERAFPTENWGHVIVVTGNKGGVGITTVAINLAVALAELTDEQVALVDLGRPFPSIAKFLDQNPNYSLSDFINTGVSTDSSFINKIMYSYTSKIDILHGAKELDDQNGLNVELVGKLLGQLRHLYKWVIIDLSNWIDNIFIQVLNEANMVLLITGLSIIDLHNMQMLWSLVKEWGLPYSKIKIVVNRLNRGNSVQLSILKDLTHTSPFETFPSCYLPLMEALNAGKPLGIFAPRTELWKKIQHLAEQVQQQVKFVSGEAGGHANKTGSKRRFWVF